MTNIQISPTWAQVKPNGFYVYLHRRATTGAVFYVGKGRGRRAWGRAQRNRHWRNIASKNGVLVEILMSGMVERDAFELEIHTISKMRGCGVVLSNVTGGGDGASGIASKRRKKVYCSNGMEFSHTQEAADWLVSIGNKNATSKIVCAAAAGLKKTIYGFAFSYTSTPKKPLISGHAAKIKGFGGKNKKKVYCSNGKSYESGSAASLDAFGRVGMASKIFQCCNGVRHSAGGLTWSYDPSSIPEYVDPAQRSNRAKWKRVGCENGMIFDSIKLAREWLECETGRKLSESAITQSLNRGNKCCGYLFFRIDPKKKMMQD